VVERVSGSILLYPSPSSLLSFLFPIFKAGVCLHRQRKPLKRKALENEQTESKDDEAALPVPMSSMAAESRIWADTGVREAIETAAG
jgi:hypothetical protein